MTLLGVVSARKDQRKDAISAAKWKSLEGKLRCYSLVLSVTASAGRPKLPRPTFWGQGRSIVRPRQGVIKVRSREGLGKRRVKGHEPENALARAVAAKIEKGVGLMAIERPDGFMQPTAGIDVRGLRERIVDALRPAFLFQRREDRFLVPRGHPELLHEGALEVEPPKLGVPAGMLGGGASSIGWRIRRVRGGGTFA